MVYTLLIFIIIVLVTPEWYVEEPMLDLGDFNPEQRLDECESDAPSEHSDHNTDSEQSSVSSAEDEELQTNGLRYIGKDKTTSWAMHPPRPNIRRRRHNIVTKKPGVKATAADAKTIIDAWRLFFPLSLIVDLVKYTNVYLQKMRQKYSRERDCPDTTPEELSALFGLLYMAGIKKANHLNTQELWANDGTAPECFRATISNRRFYTLLEALRFDDIDTRAQRKERDNLAPIRQVFDEFVNRCTEYYEPSELLTIDEMLPAFRGRCKFRQYIASKPTKYGIKIYAVVDAKVFYTSRLEIYPGKQPVGPFTMDNRAESVVLRLSAPFLNSGRNITMDNYFTSIPLAQKLLDKKTTLVGTIRKNKREIPPLFVNTRQRPVCSSIFGFSESGVLVSYVPRKYKNVLLYSTVHSDDRIDEATHDQNKPEIVTFYNKTKGGVDVVDEMISLYTVSRITCRWPLTIFFCLLNIGGINSQIIYFANTNHKLDRRIYLKQLAIELMKPFAMSRLSLVNLSSDLKRSMRKFAGIPEEEASTSTNVTGMCAFCPRRKNRKTKKTCKKCHKYLCNEHANSLCQQCLDPPEASSSS